MAELMLEAKAIGYRYPCGKPALRGLDLRVERGRKLAVLGANGSGKTTLFLCLNGILRPQDGAVSLLGRPVGYGRRELLEWRRRVGLVFQEADDQVVAGTVAQDVACGPINLGLSRQQAGERVAESLDALKIGHYRERPTHELSHGERKLVAIAGVLAMRPEVIILDEPTAGIDPEGAEQVLQVLEALHERGVTLVVSTHDMDMACEWADEAAILAEGRTCLQAPVAEAFADGEALRGARLQPPWFLEVANWLRRKGVLEDDGRTLRSRRQLLKALADVRDDE